MSKEYHYRGKKRSWWQDYEWLAPLYWFRDWLKQNCKKVYKMIFKVFIFVIIFYICSKLPNTVSNVIANYQNEKMIKELSIQEDIRLAKLRNNQLKEWEEYKLKNQEYKKQLDELKEKTRLDEIENEIKDNYGLYSWIKITWWGDSKHHSGPEPPSTNSCVGQILKIDGNNVYGTWGDEVLNYEKDYFHTISQKDYLETRAKEQRKLDKRNAKKKFKSWGLYPGTTK